MRVLITNEGLGRALKARAALEGVSLVVVVEKAVRLYLGGGGGIEEAAGGSAKGKDVGVTKTERMKAGVAGLTTGAALLREQAGGGNGTEESWEEMMRGVDGAVEVKELRYDGADSQIERYGRSKR